MDTKNTKDVPVLVSIVDVGNVSREGSPATGEHLITILKLKVKFFRLSFHLTSSAGPGVCPSTGSTLHLGEVTKLTKVV